MKPMAHRDRAIEPTDPRMRAYWRYHGEGAHKAPIEGNRPDHFFACSWCRPNGGYDWVEIPGTRVASSEGGYGCQTRKVYKDREWEQFLLPTLGDGSTLLAQVAGRLG